MRAQATSRISSDVLACLRTLEWHDNGVRLTQELQDQRDLYLKVNEILETCGARWSRHDQMHVAAENWDPGLLADVAATGEAPPANALSYFPTPRKIADTMAEWCQCVQSGTYIDGVRYASRILEPSAGTGILAQAFIDQIVRQTRACAELFGGIDGLPDHQKICVELVLIEQDRRRARILERTFADTKSKYADLGTIAVTVICDNFLIYAAGQEMDAFVFDAILANPPFSAAGRRKLWREHLMAMISILDPRGRLACVVPSWYLGERRDPDLQMHEINGAGEVQEWGPREFRDTATKTATLYLDGQYLADRTWDYRSLVVENTSEILDDLRSLYEKTGLTASDPLTRAALIEALVQAARTGERVLFDDASVELFRVKLIERLSEV